MAVNGLDGAAYMLRQLEAGVTYEQADCIRAAVVNVIRNCAGGDPAYRCAGCTELWNSIGKSGKYRYITQRMTMAEARRQGLLIGDLPVIYDADTGVCEHIGYYMGGVGGYEVIHSSATRGGVAATTLDRGFTHVLRHRLIAGVPVSDAPSKQTTIGETGENTMAEKTGYGIVTTEGGHLNLRASASATSAVIDRIPCGERVRILADKGRWLRVSYANSVGYVSADYITPETADGTDADATDTGATGEDGGGSWGVFIPCASREKAGELAEHFTVGVVCQRECDD